MHGRHVPGASQCKQMSGTALQGQFALDSIPAPLQLFLFCKPPHTARIILQQPCLST